MKTNIIAHPPMPFHSPQGTTATAALLTGFVRFLLVVLCASLVAFTTPTALGAGADGDYKFTGATGSLTYAGETVELPQDLILELAAIQNGKMTILNNRLKLNRNAMTKIFKQLGEQLGTTIDVSVTGPAYVQMTKTGKNYTGKTTKPLVITFDTTFMGEDISGKLNAFFDAKVKGKTLTFVVDLAGTALGSDFDGELKIICKKD